MDFNGQRPTTRCIVGTAQFEIALRAANGYESFSIGRAVDAMAFKVGDVVEIKSGGVPMTVESTEGQWVTCVWYVGEKFSRQEFDGVMLKEVPPEEPTSL